MKREEVSATLLSYDLAKLPGEDFQSFIDSLGGTEMFSEREIESIMVCVAYFRLLMYPDLAAAMKRAMAGYFYEQMQTKR